MRFIFAHDGTAINVAHIVTIFLCSTRQAEGYVVRCATTLPTTVLTLSPTLSSRELAQRWMDTAVLDILDPSTDASA